MNRVNVLLINLGHGSVKNKEDQEESETSRRQKKIRTFVRKTGFDHSLDLVLFQECSSKKFLGDLREDLENDVPGSRFHLPAPSERGKSDYIGLLLNETKLEMITKHLGKSVTVHRLEALKALRRSDQDFLTEDGRAMAAMLRHRASQETFLVLSFHGKNQGTVKERAQNMSSEKHIKQVLMFADEMKKRTQSDHVIIGGDTNHVMENFIKDHTAFCHTLDLSLLSYNLPDKFHRAKKNQIDYFLHSTSLKPVSLDPMITQEAVLAFNVPEDVLDHHPLVAAFQSATLKVEDKQEDRGLQGALKLASKVAQGAQARLKEVLEDNNFKKQTLHHKGTVQPTQLKLKSKSPGPQLFSKAELHTKAPSDNGDVKNKKAPQFSCDLCDFKDSTKQSLFTHFVEQQGSHFPCKQHFANLDKSADDGECLRVFGSSKGLKVHQTRSADFPQHFNTDTRRGLPGLRYV